MTITRTDLTRAGAMRAFPKLSAPGALPLGQTVFSIIAALPHTPGGFDAFLLADDNLTLSVVMSHDKARGETVVVLFEKATSMGRHSGSKLLQDAWRAGLVPVQPRVVAVAGSLDYAEKVSQMHPGFVVPDAPGLGGQHFITLDMSLLGA
jgi:hypothetical protein